jgi:hypothetical protein
MLSLGLRPILERDSGTSRGTPFWTKENGRRTRKLEKG